MSKISERSLVLSTLLIRLHSLTEPPIMQFIRSLHYPNKTLPNASDTDWSVQDSRATPGHDRQYSVVINVNKCQASRRKSNKPECRMVLQS